MATPSSSFSKESLVDAAMRLIGEEGWNNFSLEKLAEVEKIPLGDVYPIFASKMAIPDAFGRVVDERVFQKLPFLEAATLRDRLFDIIMTRFEILTLYKPAIKAIWNGLWKDALHFTHFPPTIYKSMQRMAEKAGFESESLCYVPIIAGLSGAYVFILRTWLEDESEDLSKTMAALDKVLDYFERFSTVIK